MTHTPYDIVVGEHAHVAVSPEIPLGWRLPETRAHVWLSTSGNYVVDGVNFVVHDAQPDRPSEYVGPVQGAVIEVPGGRPPVGIPGGPGPVDVPEPSSWLLVAVGIACIRVWLRGRGWARL